MEHLQGQPLSTQKRSNGVRKYPELVISPPLDEQEATYYAALKLVNQIDEDLTKGIRHYRTKAGVLLTTLDAVVRAILDDNLLLEEQAQEIAPVWITRQDLAA